MAVDFKSIRYNHFEEMLNGIVLANGKNKQTNFILKYANDSYEIDNHHLTNSLPSGTIPQFPNIDFDSSKSITENEVINSVKLYDEISWAMNFAKGKQQHFWVTACHLHYFKYIKNRLTYKNKRIGTDDFNKLILNFPESDEETQESIKKLIIRNFFVKRSSTRSMLRNPISRLWLAAELTHDCWEKFEILKAIKKSDSYFFTKLLLSDTDLIASLVERPVVIGQRRILLNAILYFLSLDPKNRIEGSKGREWYRSFLKTLNCRNAVNPIFFSNSFDSYLAVFESIKSDMD